MDISGQEPSMTLCPVRKEKQQSKAKNKSDETLSWVIFARSVIAILVSAWWINIEHQNEHAEHGAPHNNVFF